MSDLIERVAKAIDEALGDDSPYVQRENLAKAARAAIQAMRDPTDAMLDYRDAFVKKSDALLVWQHQIDEAVKESIHED